MATNKVQVFETEIWLPKRREAVFDFFKSAENLEAITPEWLNFKMITPPPIHMYEGTVIDYSLRVHGVPIKWKTEISLWHPPVRFVDRQLRGPYRLWVHTHTFVEKDGGTLMQDRVEYKVPGGILSPLISRFFVAPDLVKIFAHREERIREIFSS